MTRLELARLDLARNAASSVPDPEMPMVTVAELGILRDVRLQDEHVEVTITPTYLGCPALHQITADIRRHLRDSGFTDVAVQVKLAPPWTSDWITDQGRRKLEAAGIAAPRPASSGPVPVLLLKPAPIACPRCGSSDTAQLAAFGPTPCTGLRHCRACLEPFEFVKDI